MSDNKIKFDYNHSQLKAFQNQNQNQKISLILHSENEITDQHLQKRMNNHDFD